ncbi:MAG: DUF5698 domain-containing protein [Planctomycetota bacterium]
MSSVVLMCVFIIVARVADVSLGTIRTIMVVQGRRGLAFILGFFELLIWLSVVSRVILHIHEQPVYAAAYAFGFALGNYVGVTMESRLALGRQVVRIITRSGPELAAGLRTAGFRVTQFDGHGRDGPVQELCVEVERRATGNVLAQARAGDPKCYYTVDDIRSTSSVDIRMSEPTGWRTILKKK